MKRGLQDLFGMCVPVLQAGCAAGPHVPLRPQPVLDSWLTFASPAERDQTVRRANNGDIAAANRLAASSLYNDDDMREAEHWYRIAAARGDESAKHNLKNLEEERANER